MFLKAAEFIGFLMILLVVGVIGFAALLLFLPFILFAVYLDLRKEKYNGQIPN